MTKDCFVLTHHWWDHALNFTLPDWWWVTLARSFVIFVAAVNIWFAFNYRWKIGTDRAIIYLAMGLAIILQESREMTDSAPWLVWRLPLFLVLTVTGVYTMRQYVAGDDLARREEGAP